MTRYEAMWQSENVERAMKRYHIDKEKLDADSVNFQPIDDMDMGKCYLVSYDMPIIVPISEILWVRFIEFFGKKHMWTLVSDGYLQMIFIENADNIKTIVKMLCKRNKKLIYGENDDLKKLFRADFEQFRKLIELYPHENAANIKVDPALLPVPDNIEPEIQKGTLTIAKRPETSYLPPKKQDPDHDVISMTRDDFKKIWGIGDITIYPQNSMEYIHADVRYKDDSLFLNFDLYTEDEVYAYGCDFFKQLKSKLPELDDFAKKMIIAHNLNWNNVELKLSEVRFHASYPGHEGGYHDFALVYYGGEIFDDDCYDEDDNLIDDSCPDLLLMCICFDRNFNFKKSFNEQEMID